MQLPTVTIKCDDNKRSGIAIINECDFNAEIHELVKGEAKSATVSNLETVQTEVTGDLSEFFPIPDDWAGMHWKKQVKLAVEMVGQTVFDNVDGDKPSDKACAVIRGEIQRRANLPE